MFNSVKTWVRELSGGPAPVKAAPVATEEPRGAMRFLPEGALDALRSPGPGAKTVVVLPVATPEPQPVVVQPAPTLEPNVVEPTNPVETPEEALRIDLPPRDPQQIARLIAAGETEDQRDARIKNDKDRWKYKRGL